MFPRLVYLTDVPITVHWRKILLASLLVLCARLATAGHGHGHGGMEKLLAAGLIAKALAKGGESGGGGGHHYMPIPVPMGGGGGHDHHHHHGRDAGGPMGTHHHVHHKYVPIPVKHHTNFIIAHHKVPVPVHIPVPMVKTRVVHVPVEQTKIVPIIVNGNKKHYSGSGSSSYYRAAAESVLSQKRQKHPSFTIPTADSRRQIRITSLGTVRKIKTSGGSGNDAAQSLRSTQSQRSTQSKAPEKWIVVVKTKRKQSIKRRTGQEATTVSPVITTAASSTTTTVLSKQ